MRRYLDGIKFGMILQLMIGPMCLLVFHTAKDYNFFICIPLIITIAAVDAFYITLACIRTSNLLKKKKLNNVLKIVGSVILIIFGINTILNVFNINIIPFFSINPTSKNIIIKGLVLALANPITIVFWGGVLTTKIIEEKMKKYELIVFCIGLVSATLIFQTFVATAGTIFSKFIPQYISRIINICIGLWIIYYGYKRLINK